MRACRGVGRRWGEGGVSLGCTRLRHGEVGWAGRDNGVEVYLLLDDGEKNRPRCNLLSL